MEVRANAALIERTSLLCSRLPAAAGSRGAASAPPWARWQAQRAGIPQRLLCCVGHWRPRAAHPPTHCRGKRGTKAKGDDWEEGEQPGATAARRAEPRGQLPGGQFDFGSGRLRRVVCNMRFEHPPPKSAWRSGIDDALLQPNRRGFKPQRLRTWGGGLLREGEE